MKVSMHEAQSRLSRLGEMAWEGEDIVIARAGEPYLRLVPYRKREDRAEARGAEGPDLDCSGFRRDAAGGRPGVLELEGSPTEGIVSGSKIAVSQAVMAERRTVWTIASLVLGGCVDDENCVLEHRRAPEAVAPARGP